jgi:hypothetical protein
LCKLVAQARSLPKDQFKREVEKELTGRETEPWEIIYFKLYKSQIPVIEQAMETAAMMLGTDKSRGYCLEMICADFLAGANLENGNPKVLLQSMVRFFKSCRAKRSSRFSITLARRRRESNGSQTSSHPTRSRAAAGVTSGWLEVPIAWHDVESGSSPQTVSQPLRPGFGRESDHALHGVPHASAPRLVTAEHCVRQERPAGR